MSVIKFIKTIRNHWKKSAFAVGAVSYAASYANEHYKIQQLMRAYCEEASTYGDVTISPAIAPKRILIILNPTANKRAAETTFEKYCEPILHLGGFLVDIVRTDSEGHATRYLEELEQMPDAILIAGGDGTVSEAVTGLMRRSNNNSKHCPVGVLPLGRTNSIVAKLQNFSSDASSLEEVRCLANSAIAVVRGKTKKKNIMKIQPLDQEESVINSKPIYALGSLHWGAFRDAKTLRDKYWFVGPWREYASTLFHAFDNDLTWKCNAKLVYTPPCSGCSNCFIKEETKSLSTGRWWSRFIPKFKLGQQRQITPDYSHVINEQCAMQAMVEINPTEVILSPNDEADEIPRLTVEIKEPMNSGFDFIKESWHRIKSGRVNVKKTLEGRTIELLPENLSKKEKEIFYSIDSEPFEVRPIKISVIPKAIDMYTS